MCIVHARSIVQYNTQCANTEYPFLGSRTRKVVILSLLAHSFEKLNWRVRCSECGQERLQGSEHCRHGWKPIFLYRRKLSQLDAAAPPLSVISCFVTNNFSGRYPEVRRAAARDRQPTP